LTTPTRAPPSEEGQDPVRRGSTSPLEVPRRTRLATPRRPVFRVTIPWCGTRRLTSGGPRCSVRVHVRGDYFGMCHVTLSSRVTTDAILFVTEPPNCQKAPRNRPTLTPPADKRRWERFLPSRFTLAAGQGAGPSGDGRAPRPAGRENYNSGAPGRTRRPGRGVAAAGGSDRSWRDEGVNPRGEAAAAAPVKAAVPMRPRGRRPSRDGSRSGVLRRLRAGFSKEILRKEVIQPQVPLRLPCYDLVPITGFIFGACR